jgi:outer membrane protein assembly factor BamE (lipoprotein component of BamABCDE complex)
MKQKKLKTDLNTARKFFTLFVIAIAVLFYLSACAIWIPTPEHGYSHMKEVNNDLLKQLEPGITTKDDVRLIIGDPPHIEKNDSFCYFWTRKDGYYFVSITPGYGEEGSTKKYHAVCLEFMPDGKLIRFKHFKDGWFRKNIQDQITDWENNEN